MKQTVRVFIYDSQKTMQEKKYGLIGPMLGLDWYVGDNIGTDVILTSPANPGPAHTYEDTLTRNPIRFSDCGGYTFAYTYIQYLEETYGWDKVLQIIETEDYEIVFDKTQKEIYVEWVKYIRNYNR